MCQPCTARAIVSRTFSWRTAIRFFVQRAPAFYILRGGAARGFLIGWSKPCRMQAFLSAAASRRAYDRGLKIRPGRRTEHSQAIDAR